MTGLFSILSDALEHGQTISSFDNISGGCYRIVIDGTPFFCKKYSVSGSERVRAEQRGLRILTRAKTLRIPKVAPIQEQLTRQGVLLIEWLNFHEPTDTEWISLAHGLEKLHSQTGSVFGLDHDNFIGGNRQSNDQHSSWSTFFVTRRLLPQRDLAVNGGLWQDIWSDWLDRITHRMEEIIPSDIQPSLSHGDLWSGNIGFVNNQASIFDPAVYYGHYESDLAMAQLFGGFPELFFQTYYEVRPQQPGSKERRDVYNLYHLMNHLNLFGASYAPAVDRILRRYGS